MSAFVRTLSLGGLKTFRELGECFRQFVKSYPIINCQTSHRIRLCLAAAGPPDSK